MKKTQCFGVILLGMALSLNATANSMSCSLSLKGQAGGKDKVLPIHVAFNCHPEGVCETLYDGHSPELVSPGPSIFDEKGRSRVIFQLFLFPGLHLLNASLEGANAKNEFLGRAITAVSTSSPSFNLSLVVSGTHSPIVDRQSVFTVGCRYLQK